MKKKILKRFISCVAAVFMLVPSTICAKAAETTTTTETTAIPITTAVATDTKKSTINTVQFNISVIDEETSEPIPNVKVRLEKWYVTYENNFREFTGETEVMGTWITSDEEWHLSDAYEYTPEKPYSVHAVAYDIPEGYNCIGYTVPWKKPEEFFYDLIGRKHPYVGVIELRKDKDADFPVAGTYTRNISVVDFDTHEFIPNLDCTLINSVTGKEIYHWNTSEEPIVVASGLEYRFEDQRLRNKIGYCVKISNVPENYRSNYEVEHRYFIDYPWKMYESGVTEQDDEICLRWHESEIITTAPNESEPPAVTEITDATATTISDIAYTTTTPITDAAATTISDIIYTTTTPITDAAAAPSEGESAITTAIAGAVTTISDIAYTTTIPASTNVTNTDLPQTGNNSGTSIMIAVGALLQTAAGIWAVAFSGILRRKEDEQ